MAADGVRDTTRREFAADLTAGGAATAAALTADSSALRAQITVTPSVQRRPARDRLEAALARIADPKGEGARACLTRAPAVCRSG